MEEGGDSEDAECGVHPARLQQGQGGVEREQNIPHSRPAPPPHPRLAHRPVDGGLDKELGMSSGGYDIGFLGVPLAPDQQVGIFRVGIRGLVQECGDGDVELFEHVLGEVLVGGANLLGEEVAVLVGEE